MKKEYKIIIDTENHAGNFEREICAYITGQFGECHVGEDIAEMSEENIKHFDWFKEHVLHKQDEDDEYMHRPASVSPTPGFYNNGRGGIFRNEDESGGTRKCPAYLSVEIYLNEYPPENVLNEFIDRAKVFCNDRIAVYDNAELYLPIGYDTPINLTQIRIIEIDKESKEIFSKEINTTRFQA